MLSVVTSVTLFQTFGPQHHPDPEQYNLSHLTFPDVCSLFIIDCVLWPVTSIAYE